MIEEKLNFDENLKGAFPTTFINGTYLILGYNEASAPKDINLINRITHGESIEEDFDV